MGTLKFWSKVLGISFFNVKFNLMSASVPQQQFLHPLGTALTLN